MHLEFPPEFVHVAFSLNLQGISSNYDDQSEDGSQQDQMFAIMGEYGNNVNVYDTNSFIVRHQI